MPYWASVLAALGRNDTERKTTLTRRLHERGDSSGQSPRHPRRSDATVALISLCIAVATAAVYAQTLGHDFISLDDKEYVLENSVVRQGLSAGGVQWAFLSAGYLSNWHPLTWLSHMLDVEIFGVENSGAHHAVNLILHILGSLLLFSFLNRVTNDVWPSAFVAAMFALHPLNVESVAWISERKSVLSGVYWFLTMLAYAEYARRGRWSWYGLMLVFFALGLLSKPVLVTLPFALILLDYWPLNRTPVQGRRSASRGPALGHLLVEKAPLLALALAFAALTYVVQTSARLWLDVSLLDRLANAAVAYATYVEKLFWPVQLAPFYPHPNSPGQDPLPSTRVALALVVLAAISTVVTYAAARGRRYLLVGWLWYLGTAVPMIGIVQVGRSGMADRYTYIPAIGIFVMVAWGARDAIRTLRIPRLATIAAAGALLAGCLVGTFRQAALWEDDFTLFGHAAEVTRNNSLAHALLGVGYAKRGEVEEAKQHLGIALDIQPDEFVARDILGRIHVREKNYPAAIEQLTKASALKRGDSRVQLFLAKAWFGEDEPERATQHLLRSLESSPQPATEARARCLLAKEYERLGRVRDATQQYEQALEIAPDSIQALTRLAWIYATYPPLGDPTQAVELAMRACEATDYRSPTQLDTLAAAHAANADFASAVVTAETALALLPTDSEKQRKGYRERLALYRENKAYRQPVDRRSVPPAGE